jgi:hypothetical protein
MSDSLTSLGSFARLTIQPNWAEPVPQEQLLSRLLMGFPGTVSQLEAQAPEVPAALDVSFTCVTKQEEFDLLTFWTSKKGRLNRFWMESPQAAFTLKSNAAIGATYLVCERNRFELVRQGYERLYIAMTTGDLIVRKITNCSDASTYTAVYLDTPLDRAVTLTNHLRIGRMLLVRFDSDKLRMKARSSQVSQAQLRVVELVNEYTLAD